MTREKLMEDIIKEFEDKVIGDCFAGGLFKDNKAQKMYTSGYKDGFNSAKNTTKNFLKKALTKAYKEGQKFGKKDKRIQDINNIPLKYQPQVKQLVNKAYARGFVKGQKSREKQQNNTKRKGVMTKNEIIKDFIEIMASYGKLPTSDITVARAVEVLKETLKDEE